MFDTQYLEVTLKYSDSVCNAHCLALSKLRYCTRLVSPPSPRPLPPFQLADRPGTPGPVVQQGSQVRYTRDRSPPVFFFQGWSTHHAHPLQRFRPDHIQASPARCDHEQGSET